MNQLNLGSIFKKIFDENHLARNAYITSILFAVLVYGLIFQLGLNMGENTVTPEATRITYLKIYTPLVIIYYFLMLIFIAKSFVKKFFLRSVFYPFLIFFSVGVFGHFFAGATAALWVFGLAIFFIMQMILPLGLVLGIILDIKEFKNSKSNTKNK